MINVYAGSGTSQAYGQDTCKYNLSLEVVILGTWGQKEKSSTFTDGAQYGTHKPRLKH